MATTLQIGGRVPPVDDRRSSDRRKIEQLVYVSFGPNNGGFLLDVGEGGLSCRVVGALIQGEKCRPKFVLPESASVIEVDCLIAWTSESKKVGGLKFVDLPEDVRGSIKEWLAHEPLDGGVRHVVMATKMGPLEFGPLSPAAIEVNSEAASEAAKVEMQTVPEAAQNETPGAASLPLAKAPATPEAFVAVAPDSVAEEDLAQPDKITEKDVLTQPPPATFRLSTASAIAILALFVVSLVPAYYFGRAMGFQSEAARLGSIPKPAVATDTPASMSPDLVLQDRILDPSFSDALLPTPRSSRAGSAAASESSRGNSADAPRSGATATPNKTHAAPVDSIKPPRIDVGPNDNAPASPTAPPDFGPVSSRSVDPKSIALGSAPESPARPQPRAAVFPAAFQAPVLIQRVEPAYPEAASEAGIEGTVEVSAVIAKDGTPGQLSVTKGDPRLSSAALDAIRKWRYQPALSGAYPVEAPITIMIDFRNRK